MNTTIPFWRWEKMPVVNELTVKTITVFDRDRDIVILKPNNEIDAGPYLEGEIQTDQLNVMFDDELVLHSRFTECFEDKQARDVTVRPVEFHLNDEQQDTESWIHISIVGRVLAIDYQQSAYTVDDDNSIKSIEHLVLDHANIERSGMHIFRIYGFEDWLLVSDTLKQQLQAMNISGMRFLPV
ncbi:MAG: imm11 family protein [Marinomonas foliarum]